MDLDSDGQLLQGAVRAILQHHVQQLHPIESSGRSSMSERMQASASTVASVLGSYDQPPTCIDDAVKELLHAISTSCNQPSDHGTQHSHVPDTTKQLADVLDALDRILSCRTAPLPPAVVLATITTALHAMQMPLKAALTALLRAVCANPHRPELLPLVRCALAHASGLATAPYRVEEQPDVPVATASACGSGQDAITHALPAEDDDDESTVTASSEDHLEATHIEYDQGNTYPGAIPIKLRTGTPRTRLPTSPQRPPCAPLPHLAPISSSSIGISATPVG